MIIVRFCHICSLPLGMPCPCSLQLRSAATELQAILDGSSLKKRPVVYVEREVRTNASVCFNLLTPEASVVYLV